MRSFTLHSPGQTCHAHRAQCFARARQQRCSRLVNAYYAHSQLPLNTKQWKSQQSLQHTTSCRCRSKKLGTVALFTGIVQGKGQIVDVLRKPDFSSLRIRFPAGAMDGIQIGASVAINGTCLTVVAAEGDECQFDVIAESLKRTNLGKLDVGSPVNFERSAKMGDEIGGHTVSGHVHCTAEISKIEQTEDNKRLQFSVPEQWMKYVLEKGFVAVDGCSLTVGEVGPNWFNVYLIPETLRVTVLGDKKQGDTVNIEVESQTQAIVDTVEKVLDQYLEKRLQALKM